MGKIDHRCALGLRTLFLDLVLALILLLATFAPVVARDFCYLRKHQSFPTTGMLLHIGYPIYTKELYSSHNLRNKLAYAHQNSY